MFSISYKHLIKVKKIKKIMRTFLLCHNIESGNATNFCFFDMNCVKIYTNINLLLSNLLFYLQLCITIFFFLFDEFDQLLRMMNSVIW